MKFPRINPPTTRQAFETYHSKPYLTRKDLISLFGVGQTTATKMKSIIRDEMDKQGVKLHCEHNELLDRDIVYELAGLDMEQITRSYKILMRTEK